MPCLCFKWCCRTCCCCCCRSDSDQYAPSDADSSIGGHINQAVDNFYDDERNRRPKALPQREVTQAPSANAGNAPVRVRTEQPGTASSTQQGFRQMSPLTPTAPPYGIYRAAFDFDAPTDEHLQCLRGESLTVLQIGEQWSRVRSESNREGFVPTSYLAEPNSLEGQPWYFGNLGRQECVRLLNLPPASRGTFMVRQCLSRPGNYSLSVFQTREKVMHCIIFNEYGQFYLQQSIKFPDLSSLVEYYQENASEIIGRLIEPCGHKVAPPILSLGLTSLRVNRSSVKKLKLLDTGYFGEVYKGRWNQFDIAIKTPKRQIDRTEFIAEAEMMAKLTHENIVKLLAVVAEDPQYIITEFMRNGSLSNFLKKSPGTETSMSQTISAAVQVANGMAYLEEMKYVHRDLRAANVLVGENFVCKIADFGLSRFIPESEHKSSDQLPVRWTAPEVLAFSTCTHKSDVWSYGVLLYEIATKGALPYKGKTNAEVMAFVCNGNFLDEPEGCNELLYSIMTQCWGRESTERPTFAQIKEFFGGFWNLDEPEFENQ